LFFALRGGVSSEMFSYLCLSCTGILCRSHDLEESTNYSSQPLNIPSHDNAKQSCPNFTKTQHLGYMINRVTMFKEVVVTASLVKIQVLWDITLCRWGYRHCDSKDRPCSLCLLGSSTLLLAVQDEATTILGNVGNCNPNDTCYCVRLESLTFKNSCQIFIKLEFFRQILGKYSYQISWKSVQRGPICSMPTDRYDDARSRFSQFCERAENFNILPTQYTNMSCTYIWKKTAIIS